MFWVKSSVKMILKIILEHKETSEEEKNNTNGRDAHYSGNIITSHFLRNQYVLVYAQENRNVM